MWVGNKSNNKKRKTIIILTNWVWLFKLWIVLSTRINHYPVDGVIDFCNTFSPDSDLPGGQCYPMFEQPCWISCLCCLFKLEFTVSQMQSSTTNFRKKKKTSKKNSMKNDRIQIETTEIENRTTNRAKVSDKQCINLKARLQYLQHRLKMVKVTSTSQGIFLHQFSGFPRRFT